MWQQIEFSLRAKKRGFHLITHDIIGQLPEIAQVKTGILHLFIKHSSASLTINENADPTVRTDMEKHFNVMVPENAPYYDHTYEYLGEHRDHASSRTLVATINGE